MIGGRITKIQQLFIRSDIIKPIWEDYNKWEDYKNGMYGSRFSKAKINQCYKMLTGLNLKKDMEETTKEYIISTRVSLTNKMFNPVSWLGQATCNLHLGATAREVVNAWLSMTKEQQNRANRIAKEVIDDWRKEHENL